MKDFEVVNPNFNYKFHFPTSFYEVDVNYLKSVTDNVKVADHHSLIGILYCEKLFNVIVSRKRNQKGLTAGVIPIFIKAGKTDNEYILSMDAKDKLIIPSTSLSLAHHVATPENVLSLDYFIRAIDGDNNLAARYNSDYGNERCFFVDFKIIPNNEIKGCYKPAERIDSKQYVEVVSTRTTDC